MSTNLSRKNLNSSFFIYSPCSKSKISEFKIKIYVKEKVFWFNVSMSNILKMCFIQSNNKLIKNPFSNFLWEASTVHDHIKEFAPLCIFKYYDRFLLFIPILINNFRIDFAFHHLNNVLWADNWEKFFLLSIIFSIFKDLGSK